MNETTNTTAETPPSDDSRSGGQSEDGPSSQQPGTAGERRPSFLDRLTGIFKHKNGNDLRADLADALAGGGLDETDFSPGERAMLNNILRLREIRVEDVMVPRADIEAVEISTTLGELMTMFEESGHSRMPVYAETLDDPRGMVHIRDIVGHITRQARQKRTRNGRKVSPVTPVPPPAPVTKAPLDLSRVDLTKTIGELNLIRTVLFVPPSMLASDLMARMQAQRIQMALVIDEYGGTDGLVSLEDIVETVVGDIEDEHDEEEPLITQTGDGIFIVDGKAEIDEVAEKIGQEFRAGEHGEYVDTIGGMIFNTLGRVPARGEVVQAIPGFEFHVLDADPRRVKRVRIVHDPKGERRRRVREQQA